MKRKIKLNPVQPPVRRVPVSDEIMDVLRSRLRIDMYGLDVECAEQPELYEQAARLQAEAKTDYSAAQLERERIEAVTGLDIRTNPDNYNLSKVTEGTIKDVLGGHVDILAAKQTCIDCEERYKLLTSIVSAMEQRRSMINAAVDLFTHSYYMDDTGNASRRLSPGKREEIIEKIVKSREETDDSAGQRASEGSGEGHSVKWGVGGGRS